MEDFVKAAWNDHGDRPQDVADRLAASLHLVEAPQHVAPWVRLLAHVYGEHLGQWSRGAEVLDALARVPSSAGAPESLAIDVGVATLRYGAGDAAAVDAVPAQSRISALANASSALAARGELPRAIAAYALALQTAREACAPEAPAMRSLAAGGNNLAVALESSPERSGSQTQAMLAAAEAALAYWKQVGTWLEEERAEYRLARSRLQAGRAIDAVRSAKNCLALCERHDAQPFEMFFAHAVLACAQRAAGDVASFATSREAALGRLAQLADDERAWCEDERKALVG